MTIRDFLLSEPYLAEKKDMPITREVIAQMTREKPFQGISVVLGHFIVLNSTGIRHPTQLAEARILIKLAQ